MSGRGVSGNWVSSFNWPDDDISRVPYQVYTDAEIYALEQERIFQGPTWNFLCLEAEIPEPGDYKTTFVGEAPIVVNRGLDGAVNGLLNRCAHKGALVCYQPRGNTRHLTCVYHNWSYDLDGKLVAVAFSKGVSGEGGLPADFDHDRHGLQPLRIETYRGLVFGSFSDGAPTFAEYLGSELVASIDRVLIKPLKVLGYHSQMLPNNWKLYAENTRDSYHASLLHVFHNTFGIVRPNMNGGVQIANRGWHHRSFAERVPLADDEIGKEKVRSLQAEYSLKDASLMEHVEELGDTVTNSIQTVFPSLVIQQILNALAVRQLVPRGPDKAELFWTILGFEDDDEELLALRLKVNNLVGPAGFVSMEDGFAGGLVQKGAAADPSARTVMPMGGQGVESSKGSRVTEAAVRGFWKGWRECMGL
ncbi:MAG: Rieske 2Fe-2S domain-containing protein [Pseudomonadota bacterium]|nr:Rieske 2Fe-2S domain-containing protein [Pseudomonadota bacterium]